MAPGHAGPKADSYYPTRPTTEQTLTRDTPLLDYRVELDSYSGPMDLLLYLVRRHEVDLNDIPIAQITEQYFQHLTHMQHVDIDLAGEFLVMAATLLEIKSALLIPAPQQDEATPENGADPSDESPTPADAGLSPLDPRYELVQQLLAYKRFKDATSWLDNRFNDWQNRYPRRGTGFAPAPTTDSQQPNDDFEYEPAEPASIDLEDASMLDLCQAFARLMESVGHGPGPHEVVYDDTPLSLHAEDIVDQLSRTGPLTLQSLFVGRTNRSEMIGLFLALLELVKQSRVKVAQEPDATDVRLELRPPEDAEPNNPQPAEPTINVTSTDPPPVESPADTGN